MKLIIMRNKYKLFFLTLIAVTLISFGVWRALFYHIDLRYVNNISSTSKLPMDWSWVVLTRGEDIKKYRLEGFNLPEHDFNNSFLVISTKKIKQLYYYKLGDDCACGPPIADIKFVENTFQPDTYYIYEMEKIWIGQMTNELFND
ncbi:MAG: hypothetical protein P0Y55_08380 [Candidatus Cohnella colombiensis]|uniref:Uncharacterized protein n=1 Tax=Candidatus Cohnella colombiensis TaxID=3121368 RepID=A0AA95JHH7_9BACL|nr:MAG: hypothetical protein P0Y55_08380 [Cohnella sp.]